MEYQQVNISDETTIKAELVIRGENFNANEISETLGINATYSWTAGEIHARTGKIREISCWIYSTDTLETLDSEDLTKQIYNLFSPKTAVLQELKTKYDLNITLGLVVIIENQSPPGICLDSDTIDFLNKLDANLDVDLYVN